MNDRPQKAAKNHCKPRGGRSAEGTPSPCTAGSSGAGPAAARLGPRGLLERFSQRPSFVLEGLHRLGIAPRPQVGAGLA